MDFPAAKAFIDEAWDQRVMPALLDYIAIPCLSPAFAPDWASEGHLDRAVSLLTGWAQRELRNIEGATVEVVRPHGATPTIFIDIPGTRPGSILFYGHYDKQPPMTGWAAGRAAFEPVIEDGKLYGRGGADDGYAMFSALLAVLALRAQGFGHPRIMILIEGSEESGSGDLAPAINHLGARLGEPSILVALDAGCGDFERLWVTTSLRGQVAGTLRVQTLREGVHSGDASGIVASPDRVARQLLSRVEDAETGMVDARFHASIPAHRMAEAEVAGRILGQAIYESFPTVPGSGPVIDDPAQQLLNRAWRPQLAITGLSGLPAVHEGAAVLYPGIELRLSLRLPPTVDPAGAAVALRSLLEHDPPYGCAVEFRPDMESPGWNAPQTDPAFASALDRASELSFGQAAASFGGGGGIPFLAMLGERFPQAQFLVTGVLGPESNAHGPNEFLHLDMVRRVTAALSTFIHAPEDEQ